MTTPSTTASPGRRWGLAAFGVLYASGGIVGTAQGEYAAGIPAIIAGLFIALIALTAPEGAGTVVLATLVVYAGVVAMTDQGNYWLGIGLIVASPLIAMWIAHSWEKAQAGKAKATVTTTLSTTPRRLSIPESVRHEVWRRDQARCVDCGSQENLEFDHIIPVSKGGSSTARNIELRCQSCNRRKGARI